MAQQPGGRSTLTSINLIVEEFNSRFPSPLPVTPFWGGAPILKLLGALPCIVSSMNAAGVERDS